MDKLRMMQWVLLAIVFYFFATQVQHPQMQIVLWKLGHITVASFLGYWIDRRAFRTSRIDLSSPPMHHVRRAIIIVGAMVSVAVGM